MWHVAQQWMLMHCRGGLSVPANLAAVHWGGNRHIKIAKIPNAFTEAEVDRLQCGLSVEIFLGMWARHKSVRRHQLPAFIEQFNKLLLRTYAVPWELSPLITSATAFAFLDRAYNAALEDIAQ